VKFSLPHFGQLPLQVNVKGMQYPEIPAPEFDKTRDQAQPKHADPPLMTTGRHLGLTMTDALATTNPCGSRLGSVFFQHSQRDEATAAPSWPALPQPQHLRRQRLP